MKKLTIMIFLVGSVSFGQNFFEAQEPQYEEESSQTSAFQTEQSYSAPDQGLDADDDGPGNPGEVPVDNWIFLLPIAGITIGFYFLKKKKSNLI